MTLTAVPLFLVAPGRTEGELGSAMSAAVFRAGRAFYGTGNHDPALVSEAFHAACDYVDHLGPALGHKEQSERDTFEVLRACGDMPDGEPAAGFFTAVSQANRVRIYRGDHHLFTG